jgi:starch synthase
MRLPPLAAVARAALAVGVRRVVVEPLKILFLSAEVAPFAKAGGLADVCGSLPKALAALGHEVRVVMPAYAPIEAACRTGTHAVHPHPLTLRVPLGGGTTPAGVLEAMLPGSCVPVYFIAEWQRFGGRPFFYGYADDPYRFAFFSRAALDLVIAALGWRPDVVHAHDWHTAPAVTWLATAGHGDARYAGLPTVYTIHNLMHQGTAPWQVFEYLGLLTHRLAEERPGEVNFMARGIYHATMISTVSPTYAREILTPQGGSGLDGLLRHRHFDVHGILNGLDYEVWDPATDRHLAARFDAGTLERRLANKRALQARSGLPERDDVPLAAMVTRLDRQKGLDITGHVLHLLMNSHAGEAQCVALASGAPQYEGMLRHLAGYHRDRMTAFIGYDAELAPLIYGGSDVFLMPSLFEPCGLGQLIAMRYGAVPVVRATGGLADTVRAGVTGFTFTSYSADDFWNALREALHIWRLDPESWRALQRQGMMSDYSWAASARAYQQVYEWAIARARGW